MHSAGHQTATWTDIGLPKNIYQLTNNQLPASKAIIVANSKRQVTKKISTGNNLMLMHICDCGIDCQRSMFS